MLTKDLLHVSLTKIEIAGNLSLEVGRDWCSGFLCQVQHFLWNGQTQIREQDKYQYS